MNKEYLTGIAITIKPPYNKLNIGVTVNSTIFYFNRVYILGGVESSKAHLF